MSFLAVATIGGGLLVAGSAKKSAKSAAAAQTASAEAGINEERRQFDLVQELLQPFTDAGTSAIGEQLALAGLSGPEAERAAIGRIEQGVQFQSLTEQGENAILQNASATGGLRGGNTQDALAQFRPQVLSGLIDKQFGQLGGITGIGQASAAQTGAAAQQSAGAISSLYGQQGAAQAGSALAAGQADANLIGQLGGAFGNIIGGSGGFNSGITIGGSNSLFSGGF